MRTDLLLPFGGFPLARQRRHVQAADITVCDFDIDIVLVERFRVEFVVFRLTFRTPWREVPPILRRYRC